MVFGRNMRAHRERRGWSQSELARQMANAGWPKYSQVAVSRTEDGTRMVRLDEALALSRILGTTVDAMLAPPAATQWAQQLREQLDLAYESIRQIDGGVKNFVQARRRLAELLAAQPIGHEFVQLLAEHEALSSTVHLAKGMAERGKDGLFNVVGVSYDEAVQDEDHEEQPVRRVEVVFAKDDAREASEFAKLFGARDRERS
ncbi:MAG: helix-turn-helix domain-containing protein [Actinomycetota bacterium]